MLKLIEPVTPEEVSQPFRGGDSIWSPAGIDSSSMWANVEDVELHVSQPFRGGDSIWSPAGIDSSSMWANVEDVELHVDSIWNFIWSLTSSIWNFIWSLTSSIWNSYGFDS
ncbi:hypothetical protein CVT25_005818 [Psilocybe cyanescens]|uniref:Uncharacterized protein n=1 Tax=Psilocybe cyanescens TaxID=93625 RepID=A0A409X9Z3_PSICY|nr:hypothetical protein CVT25_005818 [Psilocybe cyanescens]